MLNKTEAKSRLLYMNDFSKENMLEFIDWMSEECEEEKQRLKRHSRAMRDKAHKFKHKVQVLESICEELVEKPKGVESHSWSDYKEENDI